MSDSRVPILIALVAWCELLWVLLHEVGLAEVGLAGWRPDCCGLRWPQNINETLTTLYEFRLI